jgi:predicted HicB family RNase H-like nuclease
MSTKSTASNATRITVKVPDDLHKAVRVLGIERGISLTDLVIEALRQMLAQERKSR